MISGLVLDASIALAWCFPDEGTAQADETYRLVQVEGACAPAVWPLEVANALINAQRRGRITEAYATAIGADLASLPIAIEPVSTDDALGRVAALAAAHGLSTYDASYLDLAMRKGLPLASLDARLTKAAAAAGVRPPG